MLERTKHNCSITTILSSIFMLLALAWLTVCLPYVNESRQQLKTAFIYSGQEVPETESSNPLTNTTEEKTESGTSLPSEYLHNQFQMVHSFLDVSAYFKCHPSDLYLAYHPDLLIPPPEA